MSRANVHPHLTHSLPHSRCCIFTSLAALPIVKALKLFSFHFRLSLLELLWRSLCPVLRRLSLLKCSESWHSVSFFTVSLRWNAWLCQIGTFTESFIATFPTDCDGSETLSFFSFFSFSLSHFFSPFIPRARGCFIHFFELLLTLSTTRYERQKTSHSLVRCPHQRQKKKTHRFSAARY